MSILLQFKASPNNFVRIFPPFCFHLIFVPPSKKSSKVVFLSFQRQNVNRSKGFCSYFCLVCGGWGSKTILQLRYDYDSEKKFSLVAAFYRASQSAHHPHKSHDEHRQCNPGCGIHCAVLLDSDNSYTTPFEIPFLIRSPLWWRYMSKGIFRHPGHTNP